MPHRVSRPTQVNGRFVKKRIHVRIEHVTPSRCREDFLRRCKANDEARHAAKVNGTPLPALKRQPKGPRTEGFLLENVKMETITPVGGGAGQRECSVARGWRRAGAPSDGNRASCAVLQPRPMCRSLTISSRRVCCRRPCKHSPGRSSVGRSCLLPPLSPGHCCCNWVPLSRAAVTGWDADSGYKRSSMLTDNEGSSDDQGISKHSQSGTPCHSKLCPVSRQPPTRTTSHFKG